MGDVLVVILVLTPTALFTTQLRPEKYGQMDASANTERRQSVDVGSYQSVPPQRRTVHAGKE